MASLVAELEKYGIYLTKKHLFIAGAPFVGFFLFLFMVALIYTGDAGDIVKGRKIPTKWKISFPGRNSLTLNINALNTHSWMDTSFPYWEGPISFSGDLSGVGYLEITGY